jgi:pimeloyl-ACP methyl ester carboxylesterase
MSAVYRSETGERLVRERHLELLTRWPVPSEQLRVHTCEGETFAVRCGPAGAPPLVLLQGAGASTAMWLPEVTTWAEHHRVHAVDLIGEPGLSAPSRPDLAGGAYARWLDDVLDGLGVARAAYVGVSLGGRIALDYALRRPGRVSRLALLCPSGIGRQRAGVLLVMLPLTLLGDWGRRRAMALALGPLGSAADTAADLADFAALVFRHFRPRTGRVPRFTDDELRTLQAPLLVVVGAQDRMLDSVETAQRVESLVPHATVRLLPDAGHHLPGQAAGVVAFLRAA